MSPISIYGNYHLKKWSNRDTRTPVSVICTIGPRVYKSPKDNDIEELIRGGMSIARINLSHYKLQKDGSPDREGLQQILSIIHTIRDLSDQMRVSVNIMLDLKGPEIRVSSFTVFQLKDLKEIIEISPGDLRPGTKLLVVAPGYDGPLFVNGYVLRLSPDSQSSIFEKPGTCHLKVQEGEIEVRKENPIPNCSVELTIERVHGALKEGLKQGMGVSVVAKEGSNSIRAEIDSIYAPALALPEGAELFITSDQRYLGDNVIPVLVIDYDGDFEKDIANHNREDEIYLDDGKVCFKCVEPIHASHPRVKRLYGDFVELRKSMNLFNNIMDSANGPLSKIDREYLAAILQSQTDGGASPIDSIAISFVRESCDLNVVYDKIPVELRDKIKLIAKIESPHCFMGICAKNQYRFDQSAISFDGEYQSILDNKYCWGVMVARGDLGVEANPESIPNIQKELTDKANVKGKAVIVATQMLLSMLDKRRPSRADVTDIHDAVLGGADVLMLSEETATGRYPIDALKWMTRIIRKAVEELMESKNRSAYLSKFPPIEEQRTATKIMELLGKPTVDISEKSDSPVIFSYALTGATVIQIPKYRPAKPIIAITSDEYTARNLLFYFRVYPLVFTQFEGGSEITEFDFPRDLKEYREFIRNIVKAAQNQSCPFRFGKLEEIEQRAIAFGLLGVPEPGEKASSTSDRAIVVFQI